MFRKGQRVVCEDAAFPVEVWEWFDEVPKKGHVYTVSKVMKRPGPVSSEVTAALQLAEIPNLGGSEAGFLAWRFRPFYAPVAVNSLGREKRREEAARPTLRPAEILSASKE